MSFQENSLGIVIDDNITTLFHILVNKRFLSWLKEVNLEKKITKTRSTTKTTAQDHLKQTVYVEIYIISTFTLEEAGILSA